MNNELAIDYKTEISQIGDLIIKGMEAWVQAGQHIARLVDSDADAIEKLAKASPTISVGILRSLERIGRKELLPELLIKTGAGFAKLRDLPFSLQKKHLAEPVPVLIMTANGPDTLNVSVGDLTSRQVKQVFAADCVRDIGAQRAWLADNMPRPDTSPDGLPFEVHGKTAIFTRPCKMTRAELLSLADRVR
jgi:hypothetical protein